MSIDGAPQAAAHRHASAHPGRGGPPLRHARLRRDVDPRHRRGARRDQGRAVLPLRVQGRPTSLRSSLQPLAAVRATWTGQPSSPTGPGREVFVRNCRRGPSRKTAPEMMAVFSRPQLVRGNRRRGGSTPASPRSVATKARDGPVAGHEPRRRRPRPPHSRHRRRRGRGGRARQLAPRLPRRPNCLTPEDPRTSIVRLILATLESQASLSRVRATAP